MLTILIEYSRSVSWEYCSLTQDSWKTYKSKAADKVQSTGTIIKYDPNTMRLPNIAAGADSKTVCDKWLMKSFIIYW